MEITTVKLRKSTKKSLDHLRKGKETYDDAIQKLISESKYSKIEKELIEGYKKVGKYELSTLKEWDTTSTDIE